MGESHFLCVVGGNRFNHPADLSRHVKTNHNYSVESNKENKCGYCGEPHISIVALHQHLLKDHPQRVREEREHLGREKHGKARIQKLLESGNISIAVHRAKDIEKGMMGKADPFVVLLNRDQKELCLIPDKNCKQELEGNLMCTQKEVLF